MLNSLFKKYVFIEDKQKNNVFKLDFPDSALGWVELRLDETSGCFVQVSPYCIYVIYTSMINKNELLFVFWHK